MLLDPPRRQFRPEDLDRARAALLASGFDPDVVQTRIIQDEARPVEDNFVFGNGRTAHGGEPGPVLAGPEGVRGELPPYRYAGVHLLIVQPTDAGARERATRALQQHGGVDPQARAALAAESGSGH